MKQRQNSSYFLVILSFLVSLVLTIMPLPPTLGWVNPQWMFAVLLFWVISAPFQWGIILAWIVGICMDIVTATPLGQQALIFVLLTYGVLKFHPVIAHATLGQQAMLVGLLTAVTILLQGILLGWAGHSTHILLHELSALTTAFIWPLLYFLLNQFSNMKA